MRFTETSVANMKRLSDEALDGDVLFSAHPSDTTQSGSTHDPLTATFTPSADVTDQAQGIVHASQIDSVPEQFAALGARIESGVTLKVEANGIFIPDAGMEMVWPYPGGQRYAVKSAKQVPRVGVPQHFIVIGSA